MPTLNGPLIKQIRELEGLSQDDLLRKAEIQSKRTIQRAEQGENISLAVFREIARVLKVEPPSLLVVPPTIQFNQLVRNNRGEYTMRQNGSGASIANTDEDELPGNRHVGDQIVTTTGMSCIEITIDRDFDGYTDEEQARLLTAIKNLLQVNGDVRVVSRRKGSVKLRILLSPEQAEQLKWAIKQGELAEFDVVDAEVSESTIRACEMTEEELWLPYLEPTDRSVELSQLLSQVSSPIPVVRKRALVALVTRAAGSFDAAEVLLPLFRDPDDGVRVLASRAMGRLAQSNESLLPVLVDQLLDRDVDIQALALRALVKAAGQASSARGAVEFLLKQSADEYIKVCAIEVLIGSGVFSSEHIDKLVSAAASNTPEIRQAAVRILEWFVDECTDSDLVSAAKKQLIKLQTLDS